MMREGRWIWPREAGQVNEFVEFRVEFDVPGDALGEARLHIAADSQYAVWLNGTLIGTGQYTGFPDEAFFNTFAVSPALAVGPNLLAIAAHSCGVEHFSYMVSGNPGVFYRLETTAGTVLAESGCGRSTMRLSPAYRRGKMPRITNQLPFTFEYDASRTDDWRQREYQPDQTWRPVTPDDCASKGASRTLCPLPISHWIVGSRAPARVIAQGRFHNGAPDTLPVGAEMQTAFLSSREPREIFADPPEAPIPLSAFPGGLALRAGVENAYVVLDLGREECGFLEFDISAGAGTIVDIGYGQHLDSLRVRTAVGERYFASRYRCREGRQSFTHWVTRVSGRYLQFHLHGNLTGFRLHGAGIRAATWPAEVRGAYASPDRLDARIWDVSARTLHLCLHEHYEDTPWREQGLYAGDSLIQALCGYYAFGEYAFPAFSFSLLGKSLHSDGWLELCAPARVPITIPAFSACWIMAQADHYMHGADRQTAAKNLPVVRRLLDGWMAQIQEDLLPSPRGERFWHFYDWTPHLSGCSPDGMRFTVLHELRYDAPLNAFFILALDSGALLAEACERSDWAAIWRETATRVRRAFHRRFWDAEKSRYKTSSSESLEFSELVQALALCARILQSADRRTELYGLLASPDNPLVPSTLSQTLFTLRALAPEPRYREGIINRIRQEWGNMMLQGATSCWETSRGSWDFDQAGSLCHGWSALPIYTFGAWVLGVRPLEPGFRKFTVDPDPTLAAGTSGQIPTPFGVITVAHRSNGKNGMTTELTHPDGTLPVYISPPSEPAD